MWFVSYEYLLKRLTYISVHCKVNAAFRLDYILIPGHINLIGVKGWWHPLLHWHHEQTNCFIIHYSPCQCLLRHYSPYQCLLRHYVSAWYEHINLFPALEIIMWWWWKRMRWEGDWINKWDVLFQKWHDTLIREKEREGGGWERDESLLLIDHDLRKDVDLKNKNKKERGQG